MSKTKWHYLEQYIASSDHKITINLVGVGGTGSHVLANLAMINYSLIKLGRQPLFVRAWDPDVITEHNIGRQMFSPADEGKNKAEVLITRINRFYGLQWISMLESFPRPGERDRTDSGANFTISCVDTVKSRKKIASAFSKEGRHSHFSVSYYWLDIGNNQQSGQIILGTLRPIKQPKGNYNRMLPLFTDEFPDVKDNKATPSCSMAEALASQDLFINKFMATYATHMLWDLLKNFRINYRGLYINLKDIKISKIPLT